MEKSPPVDIVRWITPKPSALSQVIGYRERLKNSAGSLPSSQTSTSSSKNDRRIVASFIGIVRDSSMKDVSMIGKQIYQISAHTPLNKRLRGLVIPDSVFRKETKPWIEVYFVSETICREINVRIRKKTRNRSNKKKTNETSGCSQAFENMDVVGTAESAGESSEDLFQVDDDKPARHGSQKSATTAPAISQSWEPYDASGNLRSTSILYNKSAWSNWPTYHVLAEIKKLDQEKAIRSLRQSILRQHVKSQVSESIVSSFNTDGLDKILKKVVLFHKKFTNCHPLIRSMLRHWKNKEEKRKWLKSKAKLKNAALTTDQEKKMLSSVTGRTSVETHEVNDHRISKELQKQVPYTCILATVSQILHMSGADMILGSLANRRAFLRFLRRLLLYGGSKFCLPLSLLMKRIKMHGCSWASSGTDNPTLQIHMMAKGVFWLLSEYVMPILRCSFYVTERADTRYQLHFYLRDTWNSVAVRLGREYVKKKYVIPVDVGHRKKCKVNSKLRFIPKPSNRARAILSHMKEFKDKSKSDGGKLLLSYVSSKYAAHGMGDGILLEQKWVKFLEEWRKTGSPTLYFVKADIQDAYPSVKMDKLHEILDIWCTQERLHLLSYKCWAPRPRIFEFAWNSTCTDPPFVRQRPWKTFKRQESKYFDSAGHLQEIKAVLTSPVVRIGRSKFNFNHGLPQGWQLSSLLCNIYYGHMDCHYFKEFLNMPGEFFVRNIDDYCYVSPDPARVAKFYNILHGGIPEYNCFLNIAKTRHNLGVSSSSVVSSSSCVIKFVGWNFCLSSGHIGRDFDSYAGLDTSCTLSFLMKPTDSTNYAIDFICNRLTYLSPLRLHSILVNPTYNCKSKLLANVFEAGLMAAFRFYAMCRVMLCSASEVDRKDVVWKIYCGIYGCARLIARVVLNHISRSSSRGPSVLHYRCHGDPGCECHAPGCLPSPSSACGITKPEIVYVVLRAFILKLKRHKEVFKRNLLPLIKFRTRKLCEDMDDGYLPACISSKLPTSFVAIKN